MDRIFRRCAHCVHRVGKQASPPPRPTLFGVTIGCMEMEGKVVVERKKKFFQRSRAALRYDPRGSIGVAPRSCIMLPFVGQHGGFGRVSVCVFCFFIIIHAQRTYCCPATERLIRPDMETTCALRACGLRDASVPHTQTHSTKPPPYA